MKRFDWANPANWASQVRTVLWQRPGNSDRQRFEPSMRYQRFRRPQAFTAGFRYVARTCLASRKTVPVRREKATTHIRSGLSRVTGRNEIAHDRYGPKTTPTIPLRSKPDLYEHRSSGTFQFSTLIENPPLGGIRRKQSGTAVPEALAVGWKATPRHRKFPAQTWAGPRRCRASSGAPNSGRPAITIVLSCWVNLLGQEMIRLRSNWPCSPPATIRSMTGGAVSSIGISTMLRIAKTLR